jgi:hypothetical protein
MASGRGRHDLAISQQLIVAARQSHEAVMPGMSEVAGHTCQQKEECRLTLMLGHVAGDRPVMVPPSCCSGR